ncbi:MAG: lipid-A-disaccharide synthase [Oceanococcus sp.]
MRIAIVAGETSGDLLGADLIQALQRRMPDLEIEGVTGPALRSCGCQSLADMQELAVMGIAEVAGELPRLLKLRKRLLQHWLDNPPDLFIGIDSPDFNLGLEFKLKVAGVKTVHYVSPTVWAWRPKRVHKIARAADLLLCLFPFEPACYEQVPVKAVFVGHPFAAQIKTLASKALCRAQLGLSADQRVLAVLPGSRGGEVGKMAPVLCKTIVRLRRRIPGLQFVIPAANPKVKAMLQEHLRELEPSPDIVLVDGQMREVLRSADAAIVTSGTATLETMLVGTPFVVAYIGSPFTAWLLQEVGMLKIQHVALPNILAGREVAPEFIQADAVPENLTAAAAQLLLRHHWAERQIETFAPLATQLDQASGEIGADAVMALCSAE